MRGTIFQDDGAATDRGRLRSFDRSAGSVTIRGQVRGLGFEACEAGRGWGSPTSWPLASASCCLSTAASVTTRTSHDETCGSSRPRCSRWLVSAPRSPPPTSTTSILSDPLYTSFCDVSATVSCTQVYQSRFGTVAGIPVAIFGAHLVRRARRCCRSAGMVARPQVRESIPGYLFALSTLALAVGPVPALRVGRHAESVLPAVPAHGCRRHRAVFIVSGAATSVPMTTLPRRLTQDLRVLVGSPLAIAVTVLFVAGAASTLAFFPREGVDGRARRRRRRRRRADQRSELEQFMATGAADSARHPARWRQGAHRQVQRFSVPGVRPSRTWPTSRSSPSTKRRIPAR